MNEPKLNVIYGRISPYIEIDKRHIEAIAHEYWAAKEKQSTCHLGVTIFTAKSLLPLENWGLAK